MVRVQIFKSFKSSTNIKLFRTIPILTDDCYNMIKIRKKTKTKTKTKKRKKRYDLADIIPSIEMLAPDSCRQDAWFA